MGLQLQRNAGLIPPIGVCFHGNNLPPWNLCPDKVAADAETVSRDLQLPAPGATGLPTNHNETEAGQEPKLRLVLIHAKASVRQSPKQWRWSRMALALLLRESATRISRGPVS